MGGLEDTHQPVLLELSVDALAIKPSGVYLDGTFGRGGHSRLILQRLSQEGRLIAIDKDPEAIAFAEKNFAGDARFMIVKGSFANLAEVADAAHVMGRVNGVLLDLGVSSPQLDQAERGFSFLQDGPLDMRMDPACGQSAATWLARVGGKELAQVLKEYGEERHAKRIAQAIVQARQNGPIRTTRALAEIVTRANPSWEQGKHPATRSFQAIRIYINQELEDLKRCLARVVEVLAPAGRLVVISFHSLEDRIVKRFMREQSKGDSFPAGVPVTQAQLQPRVQLVGRPRYADEREVAANPRARSAVLRVAERLA
jgi:16S rRNA (cytosine1402-N4)-methyltransferase